jgi:DNA-binding XRE family transcriptional regulator
MPNIASVLKEEIARVARKEMRETTDRLKKSSAQHRSDLAALKRRIAELESAIARLRKASARGGNTGAPAAAAGDDDGGRAFRYSAKGLASQRQRLGLSAAQMGALLGVSGQSIYKWEEGAARPRARHFPAIAELRGLGKREVTARLEALAGGAEAPAAAE